MKEAEYNPRWYCYALIAITSLITFSAVSNIAISLTFKGSPAVALAFGVITFAFSFIVLVLDRTQCFIETFDYKSIWDGKFEGYCLVFFTLFWIVGVGFITQVDGIGYLTLNIYFGSWLTLFSVIYTLNEWSAAKDILSIAELTGLSATLKSWYCVFLSSLVVFGTSINFLVHEHNSSRGNGAAILAVCFGAASIVVAFFWICVHYKFIEKITQGGWIELGCGVFIVLLWIVGTALVTQDGGVGATINGSTCNEAIFTAVDVADAKNCSFIVILKDNTTEEYSCYYVAGQEVPGSNLYLFTWLCLASSIHLCFRWKAQQALQFAQASEQQAKEEGSDDEGDEDDDEEEEE